MQTFCEPFTRVDRTGVDTLHRRYACPDDVCGSCGRPWLSAPCGFGHAIVAYATGRT